MVLLIVKMHRLITLRTCLLIMCYGFIVLPVKVLLTGS